MPFAVVLGFEHDSDHVFQTGGTIARGRKAMFHTGSAALAVRDRVTVRLPSLVSGGAWPGDWTLVGAYVYADGPAKVEVTYAPGTDASATNRVAVPAHRWTLVQVDLAAVHEGPPHDLEFRFDGPVRFLDDVLLVNDLRVLAESPSWTVLHQGHRTVARWSHGAGRSWPTSADGLAEHSYSVTEATPARLWLTGTPAGVVVAYPDGRCLMNGHHVTMPTGNTVGRDYAAFAQQHERPGVLEVPSAQGELDRLSTGDANNDGYNEISGAYRISARGSRLDVTIDPQQRPLIQPLLEIANLPPGEVQATIEGKWLPVFGRTANGNVLIAVPSTLQRPTVVSVKVQ
ncbi:MAG TPA: hypothetical protein VGN72_01950 [Tepidisphaeraceae bacterium]|nr:hypothetical protein [Tepidisphaeraceae bacterium]